MNLVNQEQTEKITESRFQTLNPKVVLHWVWPTVALGAVLIILTFLLTQGLASYHSGSGVVNTDPNLQGVYGQEKNERFAYRWTRPEWKLFLAAAPIRKYQLRFSGLSIEPHPVEVRDGNNKLLFSFTPTGDLQNYQFDIPASALSSDGLVLNFKTTSYNAPEGRKLGILLTEIELISQEGIGLPGQALIRNTLGLGIGLSWLFTGITVAVWGWRKRPLWPYAIGLLGGVSGCLFTTTNPSEAVRLLPLPVSYLWEGLGIVYTFIGLALLLRAVSKFLPFLQFRDDQQTINVLPKPDIAKSKNHWYILAAIALLGFVGRLVNPFALPIFIDESYHTRTGAYVLDGTGPFTLAPAGEVFYGWILAIVFNFIGLDNLLLWGRWLSATTGLVTILVSYKIGERLFSARAGLLAAGLWAILPYSFWHERMALVDPMAAMFTGLSIYFSLCLLAASKPSKILLFSFLTGVMLYAGLLTKLLGLLVLPIPGLILIFIYSPRRWANYLPRSGLIYASFWLCTIFTVSQYQGNWDSVHLTTYVAGPTFKDVLANLSEFGQWFYAYVTPPLLVVCLLGIGWLFYRKWRIAAPLVLIAVIALVPLFLVARIFFPRYMLYLLLPLVLAAAGGLDLILNKLRQHRKVSWGYIGLVIVSLPVLWFNYLIVTDPLSTPLPQIDKIQYQQGMAAGKGAYEARDFLIKEQATRQRTLVVLESAGFNEFLPALLYGRKGFELIYYSEINAKEAQRALDSRNKTDVYVIYVSPNPNPIQDFSAVYPNLKLKQVLSVPRPTDTMYIFQVE